MMIAAFDVHYLEDGCASAVVLFSDYSDAEPAVGIHSISTWSSRLHSWGVLQTRASMHLRPTHTGDADESR